MTREKEQDYEENLDRLYLIYVTFRHSISRLSSVRLVAGPRWSYQGNSHGASMSGKVLLTL